MTPARPDLSIVVATRNRAGMLGELLESLDGQALERERFEVIVVDDASTDGTAGLLEEAPRVRAIRRDAQGGQAAARNDGWRAARAPLVAFTDDDCVAEPGWAQVLLEAASARPGHPIQGATLPRPDQEHLRGPFSRTQLVERGGPWYPTCNMLYPRDLLERLGGFDSERYPGFGGEDTDLAWRAIESGSEIEFAPTARVHHAVRVLGAGGMLRFAAGWAQNVRVFADHPELRRRHAVHGLFWKPSHYLLLRSLVVLALARRRPILAPAALWLLRPYGALLLARGRDPGASPAAIPYFVLLDAVETTAAARGALRYRVPIL